MTITTDELKQDIKTYSKIAQSKLIMSKDLNIPQSDINAVLEGLFDFINKFSDKEEDKLKL